MIKGHRYTINGDSYVVERLARTRFEVWCGGCSIGVYPTRKDANQRILDHAEGANSMKARNAAEAHDAAVRVLTVLSLGMLEYFRQNPK